ncbi:MAG: CocE/NonD family hydrolase [Catalinimonas sp.]
MSEARAQDTTFSINSFSDYRRVMMPMRDGVRLASDVFVPRLGDDVSFPVEFGGVAGEVTLIRAGTLPFRYPDGADPLKLPLVLTRSPYGIDSSPLGVLLNLLGYAAVVQNVRGQYDSEGTYIPMYSDGWSKNPYHAFGSPLDTTAGAEANDDEDGRQTIQYVLNELRRDSNGDSLVDDNDSLVTNGRIGMFGASALGNTQLQAAAAHRIDTAAPGLKCLMPVVASGEFYQSTGFPNGTFREALIATWLGTVTDNLVLDASDTSVYNTLHTPYDYGLDNIPAVQRRAVDAWSVLNRASYPDAAVRADLDISRAPVDATGEGDADGTFSRYTNMQVPAYHITGWWDIFVDGQIETYERSRAALAPALQPYQKLIIGPWTHQTIGSREVGDWRGAAQLPASVTDVLGVDFSQLDEVGQLLPLLQSEVVSWYRNFLGTPTVVLPANGWQFVDSANSPVRVRFPSEDYAVSYLDFVNFLNGGAGLPDVRVEVQLLPFLPPFSTSFDIPATDTSLFGDTTNQVLTPRSIEFDAGQPNGVPSVRFWVGGPLNDTVAGNEAAGNHWRAAERFPLDTLTTLRPFYLRADGTADTLLGGGAAGTLRYTHDPNAPVGTVGGGNMVLSLADGQRNQGPIDLADERWAPLTMDRADVLQFDTAPLADTLSVIGFPEMRLFAATSPDEAEPGSPTSTDFVVRLLDVYPDGRAYFITEGVVNARARAYARRLVEGGDADAAPFTNVAADSVYAYDFRLLPLAHTFGRRHRLRVLVSSSNWPRYQSNPNLPIEENEFFRRRPNDGRTYTFGGETLSPRPATQTVHFSTERPTQLRLPVYNEQIVVTTAFDPPGASARLLLYPNPAKGHVRIGGNLPRGSTYALLNGLGQTLRSGPVPADRTLRLHDTPAGLYFVRLMQPDGRPRTGRFVLRP